MRHIHVLNKTRESVLGTRIGVADGWWSRARGLLGGAPPAGEGILLSPCRAVHTFGMRCPLDVLFLDRGGRVVASYQALRAWRWTRFHRDAEYALEVPIGTIAATSTRLDDLLAWTPAKAVVSRPERTSTRAGRLGANA
jgi:uncharacterized membrane protein (UPF0127 family)